MHWIIHHWAILEGAAERLIAAHRGDTGVVASLQRVYKALEESERLMIRLLNKEQPPDSEPGTLELGPVLYLVDTWLSKHHPELYSALRTVGLPPSAVQSGDFARWEHELNTTGIVAGDGTLFGSPRVARYAQFDPGWPLAAVEYMLSEAGIPGHRYPFQHDNPKVLSVAAAYTVRIAMVGDWGSGPWGDGPWGSDDHGRPAPAMLVLDQINDQQPDITIHLGDVYYGGTAAEEKQHLLALWHAGRLGNFTLNSNHEMYDGGRGYFETALDPNGVFGDQQRTSYFAIESDDWVILGLDTAYYDTSVGFMDGALTDQYQIDFVRAFTNKKRVIILTHHNALNAPGTDFVRNPKSGALWDNLVTALEGRCPDFWYWGHLHNGIVYKALPWAVKSGPAPRTRCRCLGHGALPFGKAYYLVQQPDNVEYCAQTEMADRVAPYQSLRVKNGWVMLTIDRNSLTEEFWETGDRQAKWRRTHAW